MPDPGHELTDADTKGIGRVLLLLLAGAILTQLITGGLFLVLRRFVGASEMNSLKVPPEPRLEIHANELKTLRAEDQKILNSFGWVNQDSGIVRIPIHAAMEKVTQEATRE